MKKKNEWKKVSAFILSLSLAAGILNANPTAGYIIKGMVHSAYAEEGVKTEAAEDSENNEQEGSTEKIAESLAKMVEQAIYKYVEKDYIAKTGVNPADISYTLPENSIEAVVVLKDENGQEIDVYTVDIQTGLGKNKNGDPFDIADYVTTIPEEEYFVSADYISEAVNKYYISMGGVRADSSSWLLDEETGIIEVTLMDKMGNDLVRYSLDIRTGIGTDNRGNAVDMSAYKDYRSVSEDDYFIPFELLSDAVRSYYFRLTGIVPNWCSIYYDNFVPEARISIDGYDNNELDVFTIDPTTGIGTDSKGDPVDMSAYKDYKPLTEADYFISNDLIENAACSFFAEKTGTEPSWSRSYVDIFIPTEVITFFDYDDKPIETYTIDPTTGIGADSSGNAVDLSVYKDIEPLDEADCFISYDLIDEAACGYYTEATGNEAEWFSMFEDIFTPKVKITFFDSDNNALEAYTIDPTTGIGTDSKGNTVDLAEYADTHEIVDRNYIPEEDFFATIDELCEMAVKDHKEKTGNASDWHGYEISDDRTNLKISLCDENSGEIEVYSIDPYTGKGTTSSGAVVDLPQTGSNSFVNLLTVIGSFVMMGLGAVVLKLSSASFRKKRHEK